MSALLAFVLIGLASLAETVRAQSLQDTVRHIVMFAGAPGEVRLTWQEAPNTWRYTLESRGRALASRVVLDASGLPMEVETTGQNEAGAPRNERFEVREGRANWFTPVDSGSTDRVTGYYASLHSAAGLDVFARALRRRPDSTLALLPNGEASLQALGERLTSSGQTRSIAHYAIHGLDLSPAFIWLNEDAIEAAGRVVLPGLWDMHVHFHPGQNETWHAPLFLAAGITTVRDLGNNAELLTSLRERIEADDALGPRILASLIIDSTLPRPVGAGVRSREEALETVDRFADLGCDEVKIYNSLAAELVPVVIERTKLRGMRVSGHIPTALTGP
jgi:hypothetical protein